MDVDSDQSNLQSRILHSNTNYDPQEASTSTANLSFANSVAFNQRHPHIPQPIRQQLSFNGDEHFLTYHPAPTTNHSSSVLITQKSLPEQLYPYYQVGDQFLPYSNKNFFASDMFNGSSQMTVGQSRQAPQQQQQQSSLRSGNQQNAYPQMPIQQQPQHTKPVSRQVGHSAYPSTSYQQTQSNQMVQQSQYSSQYQNQQQHQQQEGSGSPSKRKEIYVYNSPFDLYGMAWSMRPDYKFRLAIGSFLEEYNNKISLIQLREDCGGEFVHLGTFDHPYPATKILFCPDKKGTLPDLIATTGDYLRLWSVGGSHGATLEVMLDNNRSSNFCAPLTSADWNEVDPSLIATSSIDTTCTIWSVETGKAITERKPTKGSVKTQLIAHDKEVYDIAFSKLNGGKDIFGSVGADGSVRLFDSRHMEYSMIVFEEPNRSPLLRLAFNQQDHNYLATFSHNSPEVFIIDIRIPSIPVATLKNHTAPINSISWAPHSACHIVTVGEDKQALIWDVHNMPRPVEDPILAYTAKGEINQVQWSSTLTDWISISYGRTLELLRV